MSRAVFLNQFNDTIKLYGDNYAFMWKTGSAAHAVNYTSLNILTENLRKYIMEYTESSYYVGILLKNKTLLIPLVIALWKNNQVPVALSKDTMEILCSMLKIKYVLRDDSTEMAIKRFEILSCDIFITQHRFEVERHREKLDICYVLSTSGSTGPPKPVQIPWSCILPNAQELVDIFKIDEFDVISSYSPYTFDPFLIELFFALLSGALLKLGDCETDPISSALPLDFKITCSIEKVTDRDATVVQITPSVFKTCSKKMFKKLRALILGGEPFPWIQFKLPGVLVYNIYGVTELSCWCFLQKVQCESSDDVPIGKPLKDIIFKIENDELLVGSSLRKCLVGSETAEDLTEIMYRRTGDLIKFNDKKDIFIVGRKDNVIKILGTKVPMEKVYHLLSSLDFIKDFSFAFDHETQSIGWFLVYNVVSVKEVEVCYVRDLPELKDVFSKLSDLEKPKYVFKLNKLPLSSHGKRDAHQLKLMLREETKRFKFSNLKKTFEIAWCETLGLSSVSESCSFAESGGNSILSMKLLSQLAAANVTLPENLFSYLLGNFSYSDCLKLIERNNFKDSVEDIVESTRSLEPSYSLSQKWIFNMKKCIDSPPTLLYLDGKLCVVVGSHSSQISMVEAENGKEVWTALLGDRIESGITTSANETMLYTASYDQCIYCLCSKSGRFIWKTHTGGMVKSTPILDFSSNRLYCGSYDKQFYCLNADDGLILATISLNGSFLATPILCDGLIFTGNLAGECICVDANESFKLKWKEKLHSPVFSSPCLLSQNRVLVAEVEGLLHCFHLDSHKKEWELKCGGNIFSSLVKISDADLVAFGCHDGHLYLVDASKGPHLRWRRDLQSPVVSAPAVCNSLLSCVTTNGKLHLLDLNGNLLAKLSLGAEAFAPLRFFQNNIYFGCRNDNLMCIQVQQN